MSEKKLSSREGSWMSAASTFCFKGPGFLLATRPLGAPGLTDELAKHAGLYFVARCCFCCSVLPPAVQALGLLARSYFLSRAQIFTR